MGIGGAGGKGKTSLRLRLRCARFALAPPKVCFGLVACSLRCQPSTDGQRATCNGWHAGLTVFLPASVAVFQARKVSRCARTRWVRQRKRIPLRLARKRAAAFLDAWRYKLTAERKKSLRRRSGAFWRHRGLTVAGYPAFAVSQFSIWRLPSPKILRARTHASSCRQTGRQASLAAMPLKLARKRQNRFSDRCLVQHTCKRENAPAFDLYGLPSINIM